MKNRRNIPFAIGVLATAGFGAFAAGPGSTQIRIPAPLAATIAQTALGRPSALGNGDSTIALVADVNDPVVNAVDISKIDEVIRTYGSGLFGLDFDKPFRVPLHLAPLAIVGDMRVKEIKFIEPKGSDGKRLKVAVRIDIPKVEVRAPEVWAYEDGLTPAQEKSGNACGRTSSGNAALDRFAGNHIWARVFDARVSKNAKIPRGADDVIHVTGLFGVTLDERAGSGGKLKIEPLKIRHDIPRVLIPYYHLAIGDTGDPAKDAATNRRRRPLQVPKVRIKVDGECFDGDSSGVEALFRSLLPDLKVEIVKGVAGDITKAAMDEAMKALTALDLPAGKEFEFRAKNPFEVPAPRIEPTRIDHTYVHHDSLLTTLARASKIDPGAPPKSDPAPLLGVLYELNARLGADSLRVGKDGALEIALEDSLRVNGRDQKGVADFAPGELPPQSKDAIRVLLNRSFFEAKTDLIESLRAEQTALLPKEIALGKEGIELRPRAAGMLSLVAHVEVKLKALSGLKQAIYWLEKLAGNSEGILRIPAQVDLVPSIAGASADRKLVLKAVLNTNIERNAFGQTAELGKLYPKITEWIPAIKRKVQEKIDEAAAKLNDKPIEISLAPLESKSPLKVERVLFTSGGSLVVDVSAPRLPEFVKDAKAKKDAEKKHE